MARLITPHADPYLRLFKVAKWSRYIRVTDDHRLFKALPEFSTWTKADHELMARQCLQMTIMIDIVWQSTVTLAKRVYGDGNGTLISGVYRDHLPDTIKDTLRTLAHTATDYNAKSSAHWQAAGRTLTTWRHMRDTMKAEA